MGEALLVLGAGGHGSVVIATARAAGFDVVAAYDDRREIHGSTVVGVPILGAIVEAVTSGTTEAVVAIGDNATRSSVVRRVSLELATIIHPSANIAAGVLVGEGSVVFAGVTIQPRTTIGEHIIVNSGAVVDHDCRIGDFVHIAPGVTICGDVDIGSGAFIGAGSTVIPGVAVGDRAIIGAGAVVVRDVESDATVVGVPAKPVGRQ